MIFKIDDTLEYRYRDICVDGFYRLDNNEQCYVNVTITNNDILSRVKEFEAEYKAKQAKTKAKNEGKVYPSTKHKVSFTKDDAMGMLQVKAAFELGLPKTIIEFSNGTKMPMTAQDFPAFAKWFVIERSKFFV